MAYFYVFLITAHSFVRWAILLSCAATVTYALHGWMSGRVWKSADQRIARIFVGAVDTQVLLGLTLYFVASPLAAAARADLAAAWGDPVLRFFGIIHPFLALSAATVAHATWIAARRAGDARSRHRRLTMGAALVLVTFLALVPWPFLAYGRPFLRMGS
jgi:hypothetical protein